MPMPKFLTSCLIGCGCDRNNDGVVSGEEVRQNFIEGSAAVLEALKNLAEIAGLVIVAVSPFLAKEEQTKVKAVMLAMYDAIQASAEAEQFLKNIKLPTSLQDFVDKNKDGQVTPEDIALQYEEIAKSCQGLINRNICVALARQVKTFCENAAAEVRKNSVNNVGLAMSA